MLILIFKNIKYKWGGKSFKGIDCSALIQLFLNFNNKFCPRDAKDQVKYCKKCTVSNQRPRITFNEEGICSACTFNTYKRNIVDWDQRKNELSKLLENHRKSI